MSTSTLPGSTREVIRDLLRDTNKIVFVNRYPASERKRIGVHLLGEYSTGKAFHEVVGLFDGEGEQIMSLISHLGILADDAEEIWEYLTGPELTERQMLEIKNCTPFEWTSGVLSRDPEVMQHVAVYVRRSAQYPHTHQPTAYWVSGCKACEAEPALEVEPVLCEADRYNKATEAYDGVCLTPLLADGTCPRAASHA